MAASVISGSLGGYDAEFLTPEQQERFTFVKTKVCGNKAVDVVDLEKNGMHSVVATMSRMQWMGITTFSKGRVEELLVAEELWNDHKKPFFFPFSSAATCTNHSLEVDQR
ncbi:hypothetical protein Taro_036677 [Colocasia esculenta]|uniref:Uncharacterized protein n=1 Tax=Colocasia esculenta TaxID=4460 RepID=A0A843W3Q0_COLES|nr:hypothetical protein [Colocasia esculenta]